MREKGCLADVQHFLVKLLRTVGLLAFTPVTLFFVITHFQQVLTLITALFTFLSFLIIISPCSLYTSLFIYVALLTFVII